MRQHSVDLFRSYFDPFWHEINKFAQPFNRGRESVSEWLYRVDIDETPDKVFVTAEIPGIKSKEDLKIEIDENILTIKGEIKRPQNVEGRTQRYSERYFGSFTRRLTLPSPVKADGSHASYRNGVLELTFEKDQHPAARTIEIDFH
ncbi:MAG: Hsp20/alpha crystallin family protein [Desulfitobacteriia bacterium]|jgi:HSP20 family protein